MPTKKGKITLKKPKKGLPKKGKLKLKKPKPEAPNRIKKIKERVKTKLV